MGTGSFALVRTADLIREVFQVIVGQHKADVQFLLETNSIKDQLNTNVDYPVCLWILPTETLATEGDSEVLRDSFTVNMLFLDQTASDRSALEMAHAHSRMSVIAKQVIRRFHKRYVVTTTAYQGVDVDFVLDGGITFTPVWDGGTQMRTGVSVSFTVKDQDTEECVDDYFNG